MDILRTGPVRSDLKDGDPAVEPGFPLDEHLVVISGRRDRLHVLNPAARLIHEARCAGARPKDIAQTLSDLYGIPHSAALSDVTAVLDQWRDLGIAPEGAAGAYAYGL